MDIKVTIVRAVQTSAGLPSQWDVWTSTGQYLYLRYRHGHGTATAFDSNDWETWGRKPLGDVASFGYGGDWDGFIELDVFCQQAGFELAPDLDYTGYGAYAAAELTRLLEEKEE